MTDNQFYRLNPNNTSYNQQNYPGRFEVVIQGSEMAQYSPPAYGNYNKSSSNYPNESNSSTFKFPSQYSTNPNPNISNQLFQIESRLSNYSLYFTMLWALLILSIFAIFRSIFHLTDDDLDKISEIKYSKYKYKVHYETFTFFVNLFHVGGYFFSINAFTKQRAIMNEYSEYILLGLGISNFVYFFFFIFMYPVTFFTWCVDIFYLIINLLLYFQTKELTHLFKEKESLKIMKDINRM